MKWEVFHLVTNDVLASFKDIDEADRFIASFEDTSLCSQLQTRQVEAGFNVPILRLCRGAPGSGKTYFASKHFPGVFHVENDMCLIRGDAYDWSPERVTKAIDWCSSIVKNALSNNMDAIVCNTFTKRRFVQHYKNLASEFGAKFQVYRCNGNFQNVHGLNDKMVQNFKSAMEDWPGEIVVEPV